MRSWCPSTESPAACATPADIATIQPTHCNADCSQQQHAAPSKLSLMMPGMTSFPAGACMLRHPGVSQVQKEKGKAPIWAACDVVSAKKHVCLPTQHGKL